MIFCLLVLLFVLFVNAILYNFLQISQKLYICFTKRLRSNIYPPNVDNNFCLRSILYK